MSDGTHLYHISIQRDATPDEVQAFCEILEGNGYRIKTNLSNGKIDVHAGEERDS